RLTEALGHRARVRHGDPGARTLHRRRRQRCARASVPGEADMSGDVPAMAPFVPPARPGLQSRLWRQITRRLFRFMANPSLPAAVRRRRTDRLIGAVPLPRGTRLEPVTAGRVPAEW